MRALRFLPILAAVFSLNAAHAQDPWFAQVQGLLAADADELASYDVVQSHDVMYGSLNAGDESSFSITLEAGVTYFIVAECDNDCYDIDLTLYRDDGTPVLQDIEPDDYAVIRITPTHTRTYQVRPAMAGCDSDPCRWGVGIFSDQ